MKQSSGWKYGVVGTLALVYPLFALGMVWSAIYTDLASVGYRDRMQWNQLERFAGQLERRRVLQGESPTLLCLLLLSTGMALAAALGLVAAKRRVALVLVQTLPLHRWA